MTTKERQPIRTDVDVRNAKPEDAPYKRRDGEGGGMYLLVKPDGSKYWRLKYRFAGKEKLLALGVYPDTTLKAARTKRQQAREQLANGTDPGQAKQNAKYAARQSAENTFKTVALEWVAKRGTRWSEAHRKAVEKRLELDLFPDLGKLPIASIDSQKLLTVLRKIEARGAHEVAAKARTFAGQVFRYAISTARPNVTDPTPGLRGAMEVVEKNHYARLSEADLPDFLKRLEEYEGSPITRIALKLLVMTWTRTGELRAAKWEEFDFAKREWRIPAERMKGREPHLVPLSDQAIAELKQLKAIIGDGKLLFPNEHNPAKPMSENTILYALYRMGYRGRATGHGFRATASTIANESHKWKADAIERQLAHRDTNKIRSTYNFAEHLPERRKMLQWWANFLDGKRDGPTTGKVIPINKRTEVAA